MKAWGEGQGRFSNYVGHSANLPCIFLLKKTTVGVSSFWSLFESTSLVATYWIYGGKSFQYQCSFQLKFPSFSSNLLEVRFEGSDVQFLADPSPTPVLWSWAGGGSGQRTSFLRANFLRITRSWVPAAGLDSCWMREPLFNMVSVLVDWLVGWLPRLPRLIPHHFGLETPHLHDFGSQTI